MRLIARAPVTVAGRDIRPGDTFEADASDAEALLAIEAAEVVVELGARETKKKRATE
jgi:hypothetical protein